MMVQNSTLLCPEIVGIHKSRSHKMRNHVLTLKTVTGIWDSVGDGEVNGSKMMDINHEKTIKTQKMNDELGDCKYSRYQTLRTSNFFSNSSSVDFAIYDAIMAGGSSTKRPLSRYSRYGKSSEVDENEIDDP